MKTSNLPSKEFLNRSSTRAAGIVIKDNQLLVMHRKKEGREYWVFPGGHVEEGESSEEAVARELLEETNLQVKVLRLLYCHHLTNNQGGKQRQDFYLCEFVDGDLGLGSYTNEAKEMVDDNSSLYEPLWVNVEQVKNLLLYPLEIRDWLMEDLKNGFPVQPRVAHLRIEDLRQTL